MSLEEKYPAQEIWHVKDSKHMLHSPLRSEWTKAYFPVLFEFHHNTNARTITISTGFLSNNNYNFRFLSYSIPTSEVSTNDLVS